MLLNNKLQEAVSSYAIKITIIKAFMLVLAAPVEGKLNYKPWPTIHTKHNRH
jgi:hypothetical protein